MQPDPNDTQQGQGQPQPGQPDQQQPGQPQPGQQGQAQPDQPPPQAEGPTQEQADQQLQQALAAASADGELTVEEVNGILDAFREQQRAQRPSGRPGETDRNY